MAWNEPGGGNRDPWSGKGGDQGPPELEEVVKKLQDKMGGLFGGRRRGGNGGGSGGGPRLPSGLGGGPMVLLIGIAAIAFLGFKAVYTVQPAERGVVKRFGAYHTTTQPGLNFLVPFIDTVTKVDVDRVHEIRHRAQMLTRDENIVDVKLTTQFIIQDPADFLFQDASPDKSIQGAMESALREEIGKSGLDEIITENREGIAAAVKIGTQDLLNLYRTGLQVTNINIQDASPPDPVQDAFDDAIRAREDKERMQNQAQAYANDVVPRSRGSAARQIEDAKAYLAKVVAEAEGESQRFLALLFEYKKAPAVTRERLYLETIQQVLKKTGKVILDVDSGSNLTYLPLDRIIQQPRVELAPTPTPGFTTESRSNEREMPSTTDRLRDFARSRSSR